MPSSSIPLLCLLLATPTPALSTKVGPYCGGDTPLSTPYFAPFHKKAEAAWGCQAASPHGEETMVHVVRTIGDIKEVFLDVNGTNPTSLVLVSSVPTTWHLGFSPSPPISPSILVSMDSTVLDTTTGQEIPSRTALINSAEKASNLALGSFGHINTFTTVDKMANRIFITNPTDLRPSPACLGNTRQPSRVVLAYQLERQSSFGCYHPEAAGLLPNDVHVIDIRGVVTMNTRNRRSSDFLPEVVVELGPEASGYKTPISRNLTLVLKSETPVRWMLKSSGIQGRLVVTAGENPVENLSVGVSQLLDIQHTEIPDQFDVLMKEVINQYGMPLSYLRVHHANLLEMRIPPRAKRELATLWEEREGRVETSRSSIIQPKSMEERLYSAKASIVSSMLKDCDQSRKEMSVSVPRDLMTQLGVGHITFNDPTCEAKLDGDNWLLVTHSTTCGSIALIQSSLPMYRNNLNIEFVSGDLAGQTTKVPFVCKFKPCVPGLCVDTDQEEAEEEDDEYRDEFVGDSEDMYSLAVKLNMGRSQLPLLETRQDSGRLYLGDKISVTSDINAVPYLALQMEQCWLANYSHSDTHMALEQDIRLISSGCPSREDVSMHWDDGSSNSAFSFIVRPETAQQSRLWLHCRMGLCSATKGGTMGNINRCLEPELACMPGTQHTESALQQVTVRGPLHILPHPRQQSETEGLGKLQDLSEEEREAGESSGQPASRTLVEVSVEVAVAISLASFLVGALSTGVLWFLHSQALRAKSAQLRNILSVEGSELQPMTGLTSGSAPSPSHITSGDHNGNCPACPLVISS